MKNIAERAFRRLAFKHLAFFFVATLATSSAWAEIRHSAPTEQTFDTLQESVGPVIIGASDTTTFADGNWSVFRSTDGSDNYGFANATVVGNVQDNAPVALSVSNIDAAKPYHRLCAKIVASE